MADTVTSDEMSQEKESRKSIRAVYGPVAGKEELTGFFLDALGRIKDKILATEVAPKPDRRKKGEREEPFVPRASQPLLDQLSAMIGKVGTHSLKAMNSRSAAGMLDASGVITNPVFEFGGSAQEIPWGKLLLLRVSFAGSDDVLTLYDVLKLGKNSPEAGAVRDAFCAAYDALICDAVSAGADPALYLSGEKIADFISAESRKPLSEIDRIHSENFSCIFLPWGDGEVQASVLVSQESLNLLHEISSSINWPKREKARGDDGGKADTDVEKKALKPFVKVSRRPISAKPQNYGAAVPSETKQLRPSYPRMSYFTEERNAYLLMNGKLPDLAVSTELKQSLRRLGFLLLEARYHTAAFTTLSHKHEAIADKLIKTIGSEFAGALDEQWSAARRVLGELSMKERVETKRLRKAPDSEHEAIRNRITTLQDQQRAIDELKPELNARSLLDLAREILGNPHDDDVRVAMACLDKFLTNRKTQEKLGFAA